MKLFNISRILTIFIGISGCFSVLFGAWLAHAGQHLLAQEQIKLSSALQYQSLHTVALLAVTVWYQIKPRNVLLFSAGLFAFGILAFSGSIYIKTLFALNSFGQFAPVGGMAMALGWLCLIFVGEKKS